MKVKLYSDQGHGWAAVKRKTLVELGILEKISLYSHQLGGTVYLEEDADLSVFVAELKSRNIPLEISEKIVEYPAAIRRYPAFNPRS